MGGLEKAILLFYYLCGNLARLPATTSCYIFLINDFFLQMPVHSSSYASLSKQLFDFVGFIACHVAVLLYSGLLASAAYCFSLATLHFYTVGAFFTIILLFLVKGIEASFNCSLVHSFYSLTMFV